MWLSLFGLLVDGGVGTGFGLYDISVDWLVCDLVSLIRCIHAQILCEHSVIRIE